MRSFEEAFLAMTLHCLGEQAGAEESYERLLELPRVSVHRHLKLLADEAKSVILGSQPCPETMMNGMDRTMRRGALGQPPERPPG